MGKFIDLTGMKFNRLTVLKRVENTKDGHARWLCRCSCGNECVVIGKHLRSGAIQSCGCLGREIRIKSNTTHAMAGTKIYEVWQSMMQRCYNAKCKDYPKYGGRGIRVCEHWHKFENFYADVSQMEHFNEEGYTLDRIDNDKDYCPENCRWADKKTQCRNTRRNVKVMYNGEEMTLPEVAEKSGLNYRTLKTRYRHGKRGADLFAPVRIKKCPNFYA